MLSIILFFVVFFILSWYFWRNYSTYFAFPIHFWDLKFMFVLILEKGQKNESAFNFLLQKYLDGVCTKYKKEGVFVFWFVKPILIVFGPEPYKFFSNELSCTDKPAWFYDFFVLFGKNGIFRSNGDRMRKQRKLFRQAFYPSMMKKNISAMNVHAAYLVQTLSQLQDNTTENLGEIMRHCTLLFVFDTILGINPDTSEREGRMKDCLKLASEMMYFAVYRSLRPWLHPDFMLRFFSAGKYFLKIEKAFSDSTRQIIEDLKESYNSSIKLMKKDAHLDEEYKKCFGDILFENYLKDPSFTFDDLRSEITVTITGAVDTTASSLSWTLWLLGHHLDVQEKAYEEVKSLNNDVILYEDALKLTYLECVIKESLRCYPPVPIFGRQTNKDLQYGKHAIPSGTTILMMPYVLHRNSELYADPDTFDPDRFAENKSDIKPWTHAPFAEGARSCVGKNFAMLELKIVLAYILRNFKLVSLIARKDVGILWGATLGSSVPLSMKFIPRK